MLGLELGGDDYVTKPFDTDILIARIKAVLRRAYPETREPPTRQVITVGDLSIDPASHSVRLGEQVVDLSPREFDLLQVLASDPDHVHSVDELLASVWGAEFLGQPQVVIPIYPANHRLRMCPPGR